MHRHTNITRHCAHLPQCCSLTRQFTFVFFTRRRCELRSRERCDSRWWYRTWSRCFNPLNRRWVIDVLSSVCIGKRLGSKKNVIVSGWLFGSGAVNRQNYSVTELTNTFAAYIRWFIRQPQACFTYLKNPTQIALFWLWNVSLVLFFHGVKKKKKTPSLINETEKAALFHQGSALIFYFIHSCDTPISCLRALGDL